MTENHEKNAKFCDSDKSVKNIILYSTGCPKCQILESKLKKSKITYYVVTDKNEMIAKGFKNVPVLKVNNEFFDYYKANNLVNSWISNIGDENAYRA